MLHAIQELADRHRPVTMAEERTLPVLDALRPLLPGGGLRRGVTVGVTGSTAVLLALLAGPSAAGSWCAVAAMPWLGLVAAAHIGIALERVTLVPDPGRDWPSTIAALLDGFDVVAIGTHSSKVRAVDARRLAARARERGTALLAMGDGWHGADIRIRAGPSRWVGVGPGHGHLQGRFVPVIVEGRGAAARPCHGRLWLPAPDEAAPDQAAFDRAAPDHAGLTQAVVDATPDTGTQAVVHPVVHRLVPAGPMSESALIPA